MAIADAQLARELQEMIAALDRRQPRVGQPGEASIARDAAALRAKAVKCLADLAGRQGSWTCRYRGSPVARSAARPGARTLIPTHEDYRGGEQAPYRRLAIHVLARALRDLSNPASSPTDRESARQFLNGSPMLAHWCRLAALDPRLVAAHLEKLAR